MIRFLFFVEAWEGRPTDALVQVRPERSLDVNLESMVLFVGSGTCILNPFPKLQILTPPISYSSFRPRQQQCRRRSWQGLRAAVLLDDGTTEGSDAGYGKY